MTDLWYDETGEGPPLVLLHEGIVDSRIWERVLPLLAERHRVIRYDQRGFGRSPRPDGPYSLVDDAFLPLAVAVAPGGGDRPDEGQELGIEGAVLQLQFAGKGQVKRETLQVTFEEVTTANDFADVTAQVKNGTLLFNQP